MLDGPLSDLTYDDLETLVRENVRESRTLEFKRDVVGPRDDDKREFLADVSAFANSAGGDLIYGIEERDGLAVSIPGLELQNVDAEAQRLESILRSGLEPRLPAFEFRWISTPSGRVVLVIRAPKSWAGPHRVTFREYSRFYGRSSAGKYTLDVVELRAAFTTAETIIQGIRKFRVDRVATVEADEGPVPLRDGAKLIFHIAPFSAFATPQNISINSQHDLLSPLGGGSGFNSRHTLEGLVTYGGHESIIESMYSYALLFRSGAIEATSLVGHSDERGAFVAPEAIEWDLIRTFQHYCQTLKRHGVEPPYYVFISLLGVRNHRMYLQGPAGAPTLRRDTLLLPEIVIVDPTAPPEKSLRQLFDLVWNAFGFPHSLSFDKDGKYTGRRY